MDQYDTYNKGGLLRGRYRKEADLLRGLYGLVLVATDTLLHRLVAVKYIYPLEKATQEVTLRSNTVASHPIQQPLIAHTQSVLQLLSDEAGKEIDIHEILGPHQNIATLYDHFDLCLVLEYCPKGDLYDAIQAGRGPATSQDIKDVFGQVLDALAFAHSHSVYHRDLKPENILIGLDWLIKLCDWGLATTTKIIRNKAEFDVGSERYMAPELFDSSAVESYDASKIDIWLLGIILLTLVFHKNPFQAANRSDKRFIQFETNREALFDIFSTMLGEMFSVLRYCLNIDPENRDLLKLRGEVERLRYFTIDEEYWASDCDDETDDEPELAESIHQSNGVKPSSVGSTVPEREKKLNSSDLETPRLSFTTPVAPILASNPVSNLVTDLAPILARILASIPRLLPEPRDLHVGVSPSPSGYSMPHNHRADALLSSNTSTLPIPINVPNFRTQRKPFGVASYSKPIPQQPAQRYNREDFFTPKSVFNHYMDKYKDTGDKNRDGDRREYDNGTSGHGNRPKKKNQSFKLWKKASLDSDIYDSRRTQFRRHSNLKKTKKYGLSPIPASLAALLPPPSSVNGNTNLSNNNFSTNSLSSSSQGKYVPPFLRSPAQNPRSPLAQPVASLNEDMGNLDLDDDEVFHLEDDFADDTGFIDDTSSSSVSGLRRAINFKVPTYNQYNGSDRERGIRGERGDRERGERDRSVHRLNGTPRRPRTNSLSSNGSSASKARMMPVTSHTLGSGYHSVGISGQSISNSSQTAPYASNGSNGFNGSNASNTSNFSHSLGQVVGQSASQSGPTSNSATLANWMSLTSSSASTNDNNGKYVPPFRRGSQPHCKTKIDDKRRSHHELRNDFDQPTTSSSVPTGKADWLLYKKNWGDYDDE